MKFLKYITILIFVIVLLFVNNRSVSAQCYTDPGTGDWWYCTTDPITLIDHCETTGGGGSQEAHECCLSAGTSTCEAPTGDKPKDTDPVCPQIVNCPNPPGTNYNTEVTYWSTQKLTCNLGTAQSYNGCVTTQSGGVGGPCDYNRISTFACCPAGTQSECHWEPASGSTYTKWNRCIDPTNCDGDTYVSNTDCHGLLYGETITTCQQSATYQTTGTCFQWATGCYPGTVLSWFPDRSLGVCYYDSEGGANVYNIRLTCSKPDVKVCSCQPTGCAVTAPSTPTLLSPGNGGSVGSTPLSLSWSTSSQTWGNSCATNNNQFEVYLGTNPSSLGLVGTVGSTTNSIQFSGSEGVTYYWKVRAKNGSANTDSSVWQFTVALPNTNPWWQTKDGGASAEKKKTIHKFKTNIRITRPYS